MCPLPFDAPGFADAWVRALIFRAKSIRVEPYRDARWSLAECGLIEGDWEQLLLWGQSCPQRAVPSVNTVVGGLIFLSFAAAVARTQDGQEALWAGVADNMSPALLRCYFGSVRYPLDATRDSIRYACERGALRHQIDMPGKHRYWRTVMLQIGFVSKAAAERLPMWLLGYSLPESVTTLLQAEDANGSSRFRQLWKDLQRWQNGATDESAKRQLLSNAWFPQELESTLLEGLKRKGYGHSSQLRVEDEDDGAALFAPALLRDEVFTLSLSPNLPLRFLDKPLLPFVVYVGKQPVDLIPDADGRLRIESRLVRLSRGSRELDVRAFQAGDLVYREVLQLWREDDDVTIFDGKTGQRVRDVRAFVAETGKPYTLLTPSDIVLEPPAPRIERENDAWCFHVYDAGLPDGLAATVEQFPIWTSAGARQRRSLEKAGTLEVSADSMTHVQLHFRASRGQALRSFRFAGRTFFGGEGSMDLPPTTNWTGRIFPGILETGQRVELECFRKHAATGIAYRSDSGEWVTLDALSTIDVADLEGRELAVSWSQRTEDDDCWLMLGDQPLRAQPDVVRRQQMRGMGESLRLRFGLMNEVKERRVKLCSSTMYCGQLQRVTMEEDVYRLRLREASMRASEYRVHVWERGATEPRVIDPSEVECDPGGVLLSIKRECAPDPLAWALSLHRLWKGSRFHSEPRSGNESWDNVCSGWLEILQRDGDWEKLAATLRWWRFPVLMKPLRDAVAQRVSRAQAETFQAWIQASDHGEAFFGNSELDYLVPFRTFLWGFSPSGSECASLLSQFWNLPSGWFADESGVLFPELRFLLNAHPILFARMICESLFQLEKEEMKRVPLAFKRDLFHKQKDPIGAATVEAQIRGLHMTLIGNVSALMGIPPGGDSQIDQLEAKTLDELKSWTDKVKLDSRYFDNYVIQPAEAIFHQEPWPDDQLKIAIARSPASRAFLVCHLVRKFGMGARS